MAAAAEADRGATSRGDKLAPDALEELSRGFEKPDLPALAAQLSADGYAVVDNALGAQTAAGIREAIVDLDSRGEMRLGKLQHGIQQTSNEDVRNDRILMLRGGADDPPKTSRGPTADEATADEAPRAAHGAGSEGVSGALGAYMAQMEKLRERLSGLLHERLDGELDGCTFMCAVYPGKGARYVKHRDALPYKAGRKLTLIYYLNENWRPEHGGELRLWPLPEGEAPPLTLAPVRDRLVVFISSLEHEVCRNPVPKPSPDGPRASMPQTPVRDGLERSARALCVPCVTSPAAARPSARRASREHALCRRPAQAGLASARALPPPSQVPVGPWPPLLGTCGLPPPSPVPDGPRASGRCGSE